MVKKKGTKPSEKRYEIEGHSISIIKEGEVEQLWGCAVCPVKMPYYSGNS